MTSTTTSEPWLPDRVPLRICFSTDWHIGTGTGEPGGIDQLVSRDADGLPFVGAKTLTGMLRDRALQVAWASSMPSHDGYGPSVGNACSVGAVNGTLCGRRRRPQRRG